MIHVEMFETMGRGVVASQDINAGEVLCQCEILVLSENDTPIVNSTDLKYYTFVYNTTQDCLVLGLGEIFNHDDNASATYHIETVQGREMMVFRAVRDIKKNEQIFINYAQDISVDTDKYIESKSLTGDK